MDCFPRDESFSVFKYLGVLQFIEDSLLTSLFTFAN